MKVYVALVAYFYYQEGPVPGCLGVFTTREAAFAALKPQWLSWQTGYLPSELDQLDQVDDEERKLYAEYDALWERGIDLPLVHEDMDQALDLVELELDRYYWA